MTTFASEDGLYVHIIYLSPQIATRAAATSAIHTAPLAQLAHQLDRHRSNIPTAHIHRHD
ncbi:hypothetical protein FAZ69_22385 [Trinickia terrae]|uniref:Uncharacterized protein n=1 Tax=Trinickia terrae TaxID=2571161 RepID=A0A4U1HUF0_9BURK|nr:hypothetical protein [Trinickia terrae]TKC83788.1 hypothetical protein FAZ69_22385 [Trinickia terrae]